MGSLVLRARTAICTAFVLVLSAWATQPLLAQNPHADDIHPMTIWLDNGDAYPDEDVVIYSMFDPEDLGGDPVILSSGEFLLEATDLTIRGRGLDFEFRRTYRSGARNNEGSLGYRWGHNFDQRIMLLIEDDDAPPGYEGPLDDLLDPTVIEVDLGTDPAGVRWTQYEIWENGTRIFTRVAEADIPWSPPWWATGGFKKIRAHYHDGALGITSFQPSDQIGVEWFADDQVADKLHGIENQQFNWWAGFRPPRSLKIREPNGTIRTFAVGQDGCPANPWITYRLSQIEDRQGNKIRILYESQAVAHECAPSLPDFHITRRPKTVVDTLGREIQFAYDSTSGYLSSISDFTGRTVEFTQDIHGNLTSVKGPAITGTSTGNDFPSGRETRYVYDTTQTGPVHFNLLQVIAPNEVADGSLTPYLTNVFNVSGKQVVQQFHGGTNASGVASGGTWNYLYEEDISLPQTPNLPNGEFQKRRTLVINPNGGVSLNVYNQKLQQILNYKFRGAIDPAAINPLQPPSIDSLVSFEELGPNWDGQILSSAPGREAPVDSDVTGAGAYAEVQTFNTEGQLVQLQKPGSIENYLYDTASPDRAQKGNRLMVETIAGGRTTRMVYAYEPYFNQIATVWGPGAFDPLGSDPDYVLEDGTPAVDRYRLDFVYDYQEGDGTALDGLSLDWDIDRDQASMITALSGLGLSLDAVTAPTRSDLGDLGGNQDGQVDPPLGNPVISRQVVTDFDGDPSDPNVGAILRTREMRMVYNAYSQLQESIDAAGVSTTYHYHSEEDPDGDGVASPPLVLPRTGPYTFDTTTGLGGGGFESKTIYYDGSEFQTEYDPRGWVTKRIDGRGQVSLIESNQVGESILFTDRNGAEKSREYDANGNFVKVSRPDDTGAPTVETTYTYDILNRPLRVERELADGTLVTTQTRYDRVGHAVLLLLGEFAPGNGHVVANTFDGMGRLWKKTRGGLPTEFLAGSARADVVTEFGGQVANSPDMASETFKYQGRMRVEEEDGGYTRTIAYDADGRVISETEADGTVRTHLWSPEGRLLERQVVGPDGHGGTGALLAYERWRYDELGQMVQKDELYTDPVHGTAFADGPLTNEAESYVSMRVKYDLVGNPIQIVDDEQVSTHFEYDGHGRQTKITDALGNYEVQAWNEIGKLTRVDAHESGSSTVRTTWNFYDPEGQLTASVDPMGHATRYEYDPRGNLTLISDGRGDTVGGLSLSTLDLLAERTDLSGAPTINGPGNVQRFEYDYLDRQVRTLREVRVGGTGDGAWIENIVTEQEYDKNGYLITQTDHDQNQTSYEYDELGRLRRTVYADGSERTVNAYDARNLPLNTTDPNGTVLIQAYDPAGRLQSRTVIPSTDPGAPVVEGSLAEAYTYDGLGRLTLGSDDDTILSRRYDSRGNIREEHLTVNGVTLSTLQTFDPLGNRVDLAYPGGRVVTEDHDALGRLKTVTDSVQIASYEYQGPQRMSARNLVNGTRWELDYDLAQRPVESRHELGSTLIDHRDFEWDRAHNKVAREDLLNGVRQDFQIDSLDRLVNSTFSGTGSGSQGIISYQLDGVGNRENVVGGPNPGDYGVATPVTALNQYLSTPSDARSYDPNGNLLTRVDGGTTPTVDGEAFYDYRNQMVRYVDHLGGQAHLYRYDVLGRRVAKVLDSLGTPAETLYAYAGERVIEETDATGLTQATYAYGRYLDEVLEMDRGGTLTYYHTDDLYNVVVLTDSLGVEQERVEYGDFGEVLQGGTLAAFTGSTSNNPFWFTGRRLDLETGYYWMRTRYLDPVVGRFTTLDTLGMWADGQSLGNGYTYAGNNPWRFVDPYGTSAWDFIEGFIKGMGKGAWDTLKDMAGSAWSLIRHPIRTVKDMLEGLKDLLGLIKEGDLKGVLEEAEPHLYQLICRWNCLTDEERGEHLGAVIGGYGVGLVAGAGAAGAAGKLLEKLGDIKKTRKVGGKADTDAKAPDGDGQPGGDANCACLAKGCFVAGTLVWTAFGAVPIEDVRVGDRVVDTGAPAERAQAQVVPENWRLIHLEVVNPDVPGTTVELEVLRPLEWLQGAQVCDTIPISIEEFSIKSSATVRGIEACREIAAGDGPLVLGRMTRRSDDLLSVTIEGWSEPLVGTAGHRVWSATAGGWKALGTLEVGEQVLTADGARAVLDSRPMPGRHAVFNLEVGGVASFLVGERGAVAHNTYGSSPCDDTTGEGGDLVDLASPDRRQHILDGDATGGGHRGGTGSPGKSEFPESWSDDQTMHHISDVATDPASATRSGRGGRTIANGQRDGIDIEVVIERGGSDIVTAYPTNVPRNPR